MTGAPRKRIQFRLAESARWTEERSARAEKREERHTGINTMGERVPDVDIVKAWNEAVKLYDPDHQKSYAMARELLSEERS